MAENVLPPHWLKGRTESSRSQEQPVFPLRVPKNILSQSAAAVFGLKKNGRKCFATALAKRKEPSENSRSQEQPVFPLRVPKNILSQSAAAVFGLGFIDAGGDWSRIGVISKESEDLLKVAAFVVIPLCVFLIFSVSKEE
ncbi:uncharacterized protein LOC133690122 isoform X2 [Populus nigra]|uniref:uncharacterized protein LOC133690122 isoform X2 n=1 Tax=Populus nigra TaxID=3691 RepID=UPI002B26BED9|nr:uncharacterized protein LOC133690122 isoform X2 [Populus nigra]